MSSCVKCKYCRSLPESTNQCMLDFKYVTTPEGVREKEPRHYYIEESLAYFRKHNGGVCPHFKKNWYDSMDEDRPSVGGIIIGLVTVLVCLLFLVAIGSVGCQRMMTCKSPCTTTQYP